DYEGGICAECVAHDSFFPLPDLDESSSVRFSSAPNAFAATSMADTADSITAADPFRPRARARSAIASIRSRRSLHLHAKHQVQKSPCSCSLGMLAAAEPIAIASAAVPSMRPVALILSSLRLPAGSQTTTAFIAHMFNTG